jgi:hypothetical protein
VDAVDNGLCRSRREPTAQLVAHHPRRRMGDDFVVMADLLWATSQHYLNPQEPLEV